MNNFLIAAAAALAAIGCTTDHTSLPVSAARSDAAVPSGNSPGAGVPESRTESDAAATAVDADPAGLSPPTAPTDSADAGADGNDPSTELGVARCGPPPYQMVRLGARDMMSASDVAHLSGVAIMLSHCPESRFVTGADGRLMLMVSKDARTWIRFHSPGHVPWMMGELMMDDTFPQVPLMATMIPTKLASAVVPGLRPDGALIYVEVQMGAANGPAACRSIDGVTLSVKDAPEATVLYRASGSNAGYAKAPMTSDEGVALIVGVPPEGTVELVASKPGCSYQLAYGNVNTRQLTPIGRTPLAAGAITHQVFNPVR
jgi:hypothetical protein